MIKPYYEEPGITIYHGDCREIIPHLPKVDLVLTDPPYGMNWPCNMSSMTKRGSKYGGRDWGETTRGDDEPFDPSPWLDYPKSILFGYNHFAARVPKGTILVWIKLYDEGFGKFFSDAELAWMSGGEGVYCYRDVSMKGITGNRVHPNQKPKSLMSWCILKSKTQGTILDPFMGSGTTLVAAKQLNRKAIGIEIEEKYCQIAVDRLRQEVFDFERNPD